MKIEKIDFRDFPWERIPWALDESGRFRTNEPHEKDPVLILFKNGMPVAYLCYHKFDNIKIVYVQTNLKSQRKGYANTLLRQIQKQYHNEFDIIADSTTGASMQLLKRCGFKRNNPNSASWTYRKQGVKPTTNH